MDKEIAEAHIEINHPHVALRMRRTGVDAVTTGLIMSEASDVIKAVFEVADFKAFKPRLSSDEVHSGVFMNFAEIKGDSNKVSDVIKQKLEWLGYTLVEQRFPI